MELEYSREIFGKKNSSNSIQIRPVGAELLHAGGRMDVQTDRHDEGNSRFFALLRKRLETKPAKKYLTSLYTKQISFTHSVTNRRLSDT